MRNKASLSEKVYRQLLLMYPKTYRKQYEFLMLQIFRDMYQNAEKPVELWLRIIPDFLVSLVKEHLTNMKGGDYYMKQKFDMAGLIFWIAAGALVFPITLVVATKAADILGLGMWFIWLPMVIVSLIGSQWMILKKYTDRSKAWLKSTAMAWISIIVITFVLVGIFFRNMTITDPSQLKIIQLFQAVLYGGIIGTFQARALNGYNKPYLLVPANILGILLIWFSIGESVSSTLDMMFVGFFPALFTGLALFIILDSKNHSHNKKVVSFG